MTRWIEKVTGSFEAKRRYKADKARIAALPDGYRTAAEAVERYAMRTGAVMTGDDLIAMLGDLADLFERGAADGTPVRDLVGDDPAAFADTFLHNYGQGGWVDKERRRLNETVDREVDDDTRS